MRRCSLKTVVAAVTLMGTLAGCGKDILPAAPRPGSSTVDLIRRGPGGTTRFLARNVVYRLDPNISLLLTEMNADVVLRDPTLPFVPANKTDYGLNIHRAVVDKDGPSLEALMNNYVFNDADSPLRRLKIGFKGTKLAMSGQMKQIGIWSNFEMEGVVEPTPEGMIRMSPTSIRAAGLPVKGLMDLIGLEMAKLMKTKEEKGVVMRGNEIIMDPSRMFPPPKLTGRVTAVGVRNNKLHLEFDDGKAKPWPELYVPNAPSTLCMWGGDVLINSALNLNAKFQLLDSTPDTPMIFAIDRYRESLEAGYVVPTRDGGMIAYVPDITNFDVDLGRFQPPTFPIPGIKVQAPDVPYADAIRPADAPDDPNAPQAKRR